MRLELKVTHTPNSKSKRPWERWTWLGAKAGSVLLLAEDRIKVLNLQDKGSSIKKKITKLSSLQHTAVATSTTRDGLYLVGYLSSGDIFVWSKDQDSLRIVKGHPSISPTTQQGKESIQLFASNNLQCILLVKDYSSLYLWEIDQPESLLRSRDAELKGTWSKIGGGKTPFPGADSCEAAADAVFMVDQVLGECCMWSCVFYRGDDIQVSTLLIRWLEPWQRGVIRHPSFSVRWYSSHHSVRSLSPTSWPINLEGALTASYSHSGRVLAVAVNQRSPHETKMLFLCPLSQAATVVDMKSCGCKSKRPRDDLVKTYWVSAMSWSHDDLFLVCITHRGSLAVLPRLGDPILLQSEGCSMEHALAHFLPVLNLITVVNPSTLSRDQLPPSSGLPPSNMDAGRQRFSVSCHPTNPMILCSDGYLGLVMQLPADLTCASVLSDYLSEGAIALSLLYSALQLGPVGLGSLRHEPASPLCSPQQRNCSNMVDVLSTYDNIGLESTQGSSDAAAGPYASMTSGRLMFGEPSDTENTQSLGFLPMGNHSIESLIQWTQVAALFAWGLGVSHVGPWNARLEYLMQYTTRILTALFRILLRENDQIELPQQPRKHIGGTGGAALHPKLLKVLSLYKAILDCSHWDQLSNHMLCTYLDLTRATVQRLLRGQTCGQLELTRCCICLVHSTGRVLGDVYLRVAVTQPSFHLSLHALHVSDSMEHVLPCQRKRHLAITHPTVTPSSTTTTTTRSSKTARQRTDSSTSKDGVGKSQHRRDDVRTVTTGGLASCTAPLSQGGAVGRRLVPTWKRLYRHINKLLQEHSTHPRGVEHKSQLIPLMCFVQKELHLHGYSIPLHLHNKWTVLSNKDYLRGCECYIKNLPDAAVQYWHKAVNNCRFQQRAKKRSTPSLGAQSTSPHSHDASSASNSSSAVKASAKRSQGDGRRASSVREQIAEAALLGILYTHLSCGNLERALQLADSLITCQNVGTATEKKGRRLPDLPRKDKQKLPPAPQVSTPVYVPFLAKPCQQRATQSLGRFMALYFTNRPLFVFPPCSARPLPPLHLESDTDPSERRLDIPHETVTRAVRHQDLSDRWTVDTALSLLLVSGLVPEAVWLAHQLGDWKSAFTLSVVYSSQVLVHLTSEQLSTLDQCLALPAPLSPTNLLRAGLNSVLQTPILDPQAGSSTSRKVQRAGSFSGSQRRGSYGSSLLDAPAMPMRKSSSVCSLVEEDKLAQVMLSQTLTDILTAATLGGQDPTPWLLESMLQECLVLARGFTSLVPEEFYLPAPPYYCPQPEYIPNDSDPPEVLEEDDRRREVNDLVQLILLVLNAARCSLPCARWYVDQLVRVQDKEKTWKRGAKTEIPAQLLAHRSHPVDLLTSSDHPSPSPSPFDPVTPDDPNNNHHQQGGVSGRRALLRCFRDLCCLLWMLYTRDKLSLAIRKYQTSKERSLQVKKSADSKEKEKTEKLLKGVLDWAECLHPFSRFLHLENEVDDVLLTAISELPLSKDTVCILGRHFYDVTDLPPFLEDKFGRLKEKLKRKKVAADQKSRRREDEASAADGEKHSMAFESLMAHYKRQSQKRKKDLNNRKASFGQLDDSVFEDEEEKPRAKVGGVGAKKPKGVSVDGSDGTPSTSEMDDGRDLFEVGSREFEGTAAFLHFLETFFLVTFGKQIQDDAYLSQIELPLIRAFHQQNLVAEFKKNAGRIQHKTTLPTVEFGQLKFDQPVEELPINEQKVRKLSTRMRGRGLFKKLHRDPLEKDIPAEIPRVSLQRSGSISSLPESGDDSIDGFRRRGSSKRSIKDFVQLPQKKKSDDSFVTLVTSQGFKSVKLNLGEDYQQVTKLVEWMVKWSGRQPSKGFQMLDTPADESKPVMQVKLPQELILVSVWLLKQVYLKGHFRQEERTSATGMLPGSVEGVHHKGKQQFTFATKRAEKRATSKTGRRSSVMKRVSSILKSSKKVDMKKSSSEEEQLLADGKPVVDMSRPISVPSIVVNTSTSESNEESLTSPISTERHPLAQDLDSGEESYDVIEEDITTFDKPSPAKGSQPEKKRRQLPVVTEEKRRNSPNISLFKGKAFVSSSKKHKGRPLSLEAESTHKEKSSKRSVIKKRSNSDTRSAPEVKEFEMKDFPKKSHSLDTQAGPEEPYLVLGPVPSANTNNSAASLDAGFLRRPSVEVLARSPTGGGILASEAFIYHGSSSSPEVSSLEDSEEEEGVIYLHGNGKWVADPASRLGGRGEVEGSSPRTSSKERVGKEKEEKTLRTKRRGRGAGGEEEEEEEEGDEEKDAFRRE